MTAASPVVTAVAADGSAVLSPADVVQVLGALEDAAVLLDERAAQYCHKCSLHPTRCCDEHAGALEQASTYRAVAARLGGAR